MTKNEIAEILQAHQLWLESGGEEGIRADFTDADLENIDLTGVNLRRADLGGSKII